MYSTSRCCQNLPETTVSVAFINTRAIQKVRLSKGEVQALLYYNPPADIQLSHSTLNLTGAIYSSTPLYFLKYLQFRVFIIS